MTQLIAEIGWNHMGDMNIAEDMISAAAKNGAHYAKFQTWSVDRLGSGEWDNDGRREIYIAAEIDHEKHKTLIEICKKYDINFMSSVFSVQDANLLSGLGINVVKIPSFEVTNSELIAHCNENFDEVIVSTGTATKEEIDNLKNLLDLDKSVVMHCVSSYPCKIDNANLNRLKYLKQNFPQIGYSDHVSGIQASIFSLSYMPKYIEKHFTTDKGLPGRDNKFAITPDELNELSENIQQYLKATTDHGIDYQEIEESSRKYYRGRFNN